MVSDKGADGGGGDYLPRQFSAIDQDILMARIYLTPNPADYELMKYLEDFQLTSGGGCVLYKGTDRTSF